MTLKSRATLLKDSLHPQGYRFQTFLLSFPKCLLAELNTHRSLVRNVGSSRAIPVTKLIEKVETDPYIPCFTENKKGMSGEYITDSSVIEEATTWWNRALKEAISSSLWLDDLNIHKQDVNRLLEPFTYINVLVSGTDFEHLYDLRISDQAQPAFCDIAKEMKALSDESKPDKLAYGDWHIPFDKYMYNSLSLQQKIKVAVARCARISYENHDGEFDKNKDYKLHDFLIENKHLTPLEHICKAIDVVQDSNFSINVGGYDYTLPSSLLGTLSFQTSKYFTWE